MRVCVRVRACVRACVRVCVLCCFSLRGTFMFVLSLVCFVSLSPPPPGTLPLPLPYYLSPILSPPFNLPYPLSPIPSPPSSLPSFRRLSIKHIQLDTLSHLILPSLLCAPDPDPTPLFALLPEMRHFYSEHIDRESPELTLAAYRHGTFSKVGDSLSRTGAGAPTASVPMGVCALTLCKGGAVAPREERCV